MFFKLFNKPANKTGIAFEMFAFPSVEEYSMGDQNRPDLIMDVDTMLLEDDVISSGCDFQRLVGMLNDNGELISLNIGGQAFLKSYPRDEPYHFHPLPQAFQLFGIPRLFHVRKGTSLEIMEVQEYNPAGREMAKI